MIGPKSSASYGKTARGTSSFLSNAAPSTRPNGRSNTSVDFCSGAVSNGWSQQNESRSDGLKSAVPLQRTGTWDERYSLRRVSDACFGRPQAREDASFRRGSWRSPRCVPTLAGTPRPQASLRTASGFAGWARGMNSTPNFGAPLTRLREAASGANAGTQYQNRIA